MGCAYFITNFIERNSKGNKWNMERMKDEVRVWKTEDGKKVINDSCQSESVMKTGSVLFPTNIKMEPLHMTFFHVVSNYSLERTIHK